jgi:hypothetical protein
MDNDEKFSRCIKAPMTLGGVHCIALCMVVQSDHAKTAHFQQVQDHRTYETRV